jgi:mxaA protein
MRFLPIYPCRRLLLGRVVGLALLFANRTGAEVIEARVSTARDYGHVLGDVIPAILEIPRVAGHELDADSLPKAGPVNRWLELRRVWAEPRDPQPLRIHLEYQVFYIPLAVKTLDIPAMTLRRKTPDGGHQFIEVPAWPITVAPIHGPAVMAEGGMRLMQADALPARPDSSGPLRVMGVSLILVLAGLGYWGHARGYLTLGRRGRYFRAARKGLRSLMHQPRTPETLRAGFLLTHRAFEGTQGWPLFAEDLPRFFERCPDYRALQSEIEACFQASYGLFFGAVDSSLDYTLERLDALCLACLRLERRG